MSRYVVTVTPPTPNGDLHLGHISGPFLSADVFARVQRQMGNEVVVVSYSDDYQSYLARKANELEVREVDLAHRNARKIVESLAMAQIKIDHFMESWNNKKFINSVSAFYQQAQKRGMVETVAREVHYCKQCDLPGFEAYARGTCNYCSAASDPSQCESCARQPQARVMGNVRCTRCGESMALTLMDVEVFRLDKYRSFLTNYYGHRNLRPALRGFLDQMLSEDDLVWCITRPKEHGIPLDGDKILSTWFSGIAGYYSALEEHAELVGDSALMERFWRSKSTKLVHFLGFDCSYSHALAYRALLSNFSDAPDDVFLYTNAFLKLNNEDFSTSRGHAIWVRDILRECSADAVRTYLAEFSPETHTTNFDVEHFHAWHRDSFVVSNNRLIYAATQGASDRRPTPHHPADSAFLERVRKHWKSATNVESFSVASLAQLLGEFRSYMLERLAYGPERLAPLLSIYAVVGRAVHPVLSAEIVQLLHASEPPVLDWLQGSIHSAGMADTRGSEEHKVYGAPSSGAGNPAIEV